jgi:proline dehydrogenase
MTGAPTILSTGLRSGVIRLTEHPWFRGMATGSPPGRAVASRFVAGETLDDAMAVARELDRRRTTAMLDHLGENVTTPAGADEARAAYLRALEAIAAAPTLDVGVSVKLTQLGLDASTDACREHLEPILSAADASGIVVMVDMEAHAYVDRTLDVVHRAHETHPRVGVCLQACLRRSADDVFALPPGMRIRLVKGAYLEPPEVAFTDKGEVDANFARMFATLLARGHAIDVATHDPRLIDGARRLTDTVEHGWSRVELQMLYGVRRDLQADLARRGYPVRVYIPYGTEWYPYLTRRLAERPANLWFFVSNLIRSGR